MKIFIRVDANTQIGLGHLVRCIALAYILKDVFEIVFVSKGLSISLINEVKANDWGHIAIETEDDFFSIITLNDIVVLDGYNFDIKYQKSIKLINCRLVCIDDLHDTEYVADLIINHAPGVNAYDYKARNYTRFALGPNYVLLRPAFLEKARQKSELNNNGSTVFICFGGLDYKNLLLLSLQAVIQFEEIEKIIIVTGISYQFLNTIEPLIKKDKRIEHFHNVDENKMVDLMGSASIAIVPASGILLETLAVGPIVISGIYADNQKLIFERYKNAGAFISAENFSLTTLTNAIAQSFSHINNHIKFFDGLSGKRILASFFSISLTLKEATFEDCILLFNWVNDKAVRENAINKAAISWDNHKQWYFSKINSLDTRFFILELLGKPVGQIRYEKKEDSWTIDYSIDKAYRNKGLGKIIIALSYKHFKGEIIKAYVLFNNLASSNVFKSLGFSKMDDESINNSLCNVYKLNL